MAVLEGPTHFSNGVSLGTKFDAEFAGKSQTYAGTGTIR